MLSAKWRGRLAIIACNVATAIGLTTGFSWGCDHNYCLSPGSGCSVLLGSTQESCCKDLDGDGIYHCVTCTRDKWLCSGGPKPGPGYGCSGAGAVCS